MRVAMQHTATKSSQRQMSSRPVLTVDTTPLAAVDLDCSGDEQIVLPTATAMDACDGEIFVANDAPAAFPAGETTSVTFTAADDCGE